jgi:hypothetical protein
MKLKVYSVRRRKEEYKETIVLIGWMVILSYVRHSPLLQRRTGRQVAC